MERLNNHDHDSTETCLECPPKAPQPTPSPAARAERKSLERLIISEIPRFQKARDRDERAEHLDGDAVRDRQSSINYIDRLLDRWNVVELSSIPIQEDQVEQCES